MVSLTLFSVKYADPNKVRPKQDCKSITEMHPQALISLYMDQVLP